MSRALADALEKLLAHTDQASASVFTRDQRSALDALARGTGFLIARPMGRGVTYRIGNRAGLEAHLRTLRPDTAATLTQDLPRRAANIATHRDSKASFAHHSFHYLLLKAVGAGVCWRNDDGRALDLSASTDSAGAGVLAIQDGDNWQSDRTLWLVENQALFDNTSWLPRDTRASIAYYAGHIPSRLIAWLAQRTRVPDIMLFADYDGVGLLNYVRLRENVSTPCTFWLMPDWHELLRKYGSNQIWQNTHADFVAAATRLGALHPPNELMALCAAMSREGLALEHEAVWLAPERHRGADRLDHGSGD